MADEPTEREQLLYWAIEYRTRVNGRWRSWDNRHHLDAKACWLAHNYHLPATPKHVRFRNTKTGEEVLVR